MTASSPCLVCGSQSKSHLFAAGGFPFVHCTNCSFVFLGHTWNWEDKVSINDQRYGHPPEGSRPPMVEREDRSVLNDIARTAPVGNMLEIGCGDGGFLQLARSAGWTVSGVELSAGAAARAMSVLGRDAIHAGLLQDAPFPAGSFDVIVMKSVIEHLPDPRRELLRIHELLKPGGRLYLLTPNIESLGSRWYRSRWFALVPGDHLWFFSPRTLSALLDQTGFDAEWVATKETYEDTAVALAFALRSVLRPSRAASKPVMPVAPQSAAAGASPWLKRLAVRLLEAGRYVSFFPFSLYAAALDRRQLGASIRAMYRRRDTVDQAKP